MGHLGVVCVVVVVCVCVCVGGGGGGGGGNGKFTQRLTSGYEMFRTKNEYLYFSSAPNIQLDTSRFCINTSYVLQFKYIFTSVKITNIYYNVLFDR